MIGVLIKIAPRLIIVEINNRPRKCLSYQTPLEAFTKELKCYQFTKRCSDST